MHVLLLVAVLLYFRDVLFGSESLFYRDIFNFHYPLWEISARLFREHGFSCWNPLNHFGQNMAGNPNYLLFYPPAWLRFFIDPLAALNWFIVLHIIAGGIAFSRLGRHWGLTPWPAGWGGLAYSFCGVTFSVCCILNLVPYLWLAPLCLLLLEKLLAQPGVRSLSALALGAALLATVFEPVLVFGLAVMMGLRGLFYLTSRSTRGGKGRRAGALLLAGVLAGVMAAPVLAEGWRLFRVSPRTEAGAIQQDLYDQPPALTLGFWVPNPFQVSLAMNEGIGHHITRQGQVPYFFCMFIGLTSLVLIPQALRGRYRRQVWLWLGGGLLFLLLAWGEHVPWVYGISRHLPLLAWARYMQKLVFFTSFLWIMAAAFGLEQLAGGDAAGPRPRWPGLSAGFLAVAGILGWSLWATSGQADGLWPFSLLAAAGALLLVGRRWSRFPGRMVVLALGLLWWAELAVNNDFAVPQAPRILFTRPVPILQAVERYSAGADRRRVAVEKEPAAYRYYGQSDSIVWKYNMLRMAGYPYPGFTAGVPYAFNFVVDKMETRHAMMLRQLYATGRPEQRRRLMQRWGVGFLISHREYMAPHLERLGSFDTFSDTPYRLYRVRDGVGRWYFSPNAKQVTLPVADLSAALLAVPPGTVLLTEELPHLNDAQAGSDAVPGAVQLVHEAPDRVSLESVSHDAGWIVLQDTFYPGWEARVDGKAVEICRADFFFRTVPVPPGRHRVEFVYVPAAGKGGWLVSAGLAILVCLSWAYPFRRNTSGRPFPGISRRNGDSES